MYKKHYPPNYLFFHTGQVQNNEDQAEVEKMETEEARQLDTDQSGKVVQDSGKCSVQSEGATQTLSTDDMVEGALPTNESKPDQVSGKNVMPPTDGNVEVPALSNEEMGPVRSVSERLSLDKDNVSDEEVMLLSGSLEDEEEDEDNEISFKTDVDLRKHEGDREEESMDTGSKEEQEVGEKKAE